jgi:hypothetical protein
VVIAYFFLPHSVIEFSKPRVFMLKYQFCSLIKSARTTNTESNWHMSITRSTVFLPGKTHRSIPARSEQPGSTPPAAAIRTEAISCIAFLPALWYIKGTAFPTGSKEPAVKRKLVTEKLQTDDPDNAHKNQRNLPEDPAA